jgi:hypothetical protein
MLGFFWYLDSGIIILLDKKIFIFFLKEVFVLAW